MLRLHVAKVKVGCKCCNRNKQKFVSGRVQWSDGRCYKVEKTKDICEDLFLLVLKTGEEPINPFMLEDDQHLEDFFFVKCKTADVR